MEPGGTARSYLLSAAYDRVVQGMDLRAPQRESLKAVHELVNTLPPIKGEEPGNLARRTLQYVPEWEFPDGYPSLTFSLATGVGKTRLMGAIMAYLHRARESNNFVLLAPRDAILRKLESECREGSSKYIFVDPSVVPQPRLCHRGNLEDFDPRGNGEGLLPMGPNVFVLSPQLLLANDARIARTSERTGISLLEYLSSCPDLVVFADESHHISGAGSEGDSRNFGGAVAGLEPKFMFAMTATPRPEANIAHEYGLSRCLREKQYTKGVSLIVDEREDGLSEEEYDSFTLDYALSRLRVKERAVERAREERAAFPPISPVLLVCTRDVRHAEAVGEWLVQEKGLREEEVLVIHSRTKSEEDLRRLADLERPGNRVRVVVQVHVLDEGWDVTNVYVIAPLRNVRSYSNARQVMGRGLRLPLGYRTGDVEADTLEVLGFGQETFQEVYEQVRADFGDPATGSGGLSISRRGESTDGEGPGVLPAEEDTGGREIVVRLRDGWSIEIPVLDLVPPEPDLSGSVDGTGAAGGGAVAIDLADVTASRVFGDLLLPRDRFLDLVCDRIFRELDSLSVPLHGRRVREMVDGFVSDAVGDREEIEGLDTGMAAKIVVDFIRGTNVHLEPTYRDTGRTRPLQIRPHHARLPDRYGSPPAADAIAWQKREHERVPIGGWRKCTHEAACFDTAPEFAMARRLDSMAGVMHWTRNDPTQLAIPTLATFEHGVDFLVRKEDGGDLILLEVKGEHLWEPRRSASWTRSRDANLWSEAAVQAGVGESRIESRTILGADVERVWTLEDLRYHDALSRPG